MSKHAVDVNLYSYHKFLQDKTSKLKDKSVTAVITPLDDCAVNIQTDSRTIFTGNLMN